MWLAFLVAIAGLWVLGFLAARYLGSRCLVVFIGGDDDRLSLFKAQAFAWTLIIVSSIWRPWPSTGFSSLSAVKEEQRTAEVTDLALEKGVLTITGVAFGKTEVQ